MLHKILNSKSEIPKEKSGKKKNYPRLGSRYSNLGFSTFFVVSFFLLAGCATTGDLDTTRSDINQLKRENFELKKETADLRKQTSGAIREDSFNALRESQASLYSQVNEQSRELQMLRGRFDEYKFFMEKTMKESSAERELLRAQINGLEARVKELSERIAKSVDAKPPVAEQKLPSEESGEKVPEVKRTEDNGPAALYESAYASFKGKKYKDAREKFNALISKYPKDGLVGNAHFWIGESYFAEKDYENAILAYETLIKGYPRNDKIPGALYKQGLSFAELGDKKTAKVIFDRIIEKFPDSREAPMAKKKKAEIEKKPAKKGT
jgi:tol-pal system protein YbgF